MEQSLPNHFAECSKPGYLCTTPINEFLQLVQVYPGNYSSSYAKKWRIALNEYETKLEASSEMPPQRFSMNSKRIQEKLSNFFGKIFSLPLRMTHEEIVHLTGLNG